MIADKLKYIRIIRLALGLSESELYRKLGSKWKTWQGYHINRLELLVHERQQKIRNAVGDDDFGICEAFENAMEALIETHGLLNEDLKRYLTKNGRTRVVTITRALGEKYGYSNQDLFKAARDLGVIREQEKEQRIGKKGKLLKPRNVTYWRLPPSYEDD